MNNESPVESRSGTQSFVFLSELLLTASHTFVCTAIFQVPFFDILCCVFAAACALGVEAKHTFESVPFTFALGTHFHGWLQKRTLAFIWVVASWIVASLAKLAVLRCAVGEETGRTRGASFQPVVPLTSREGCLR